MHGQQNILKKSNFCAGCRTQDRSAHSLVVIPTSCLCSEDECVRCCRDLVEDAVEVRRRALVLYTSDSFSGVI